MSSHVLKWEAYRDSRVATYDFRARTRYQAVADRLFAMGLRVGDSILDVGAGSCQFWQYMQSRGWEGRYVPVDAVIDGVDLETWTPPMREDFIVCIEVVEHLQNPSRLIKALLRAARYGVVLTTPNSEAVDVIACDPTHVSIVPAHVLQLLGFTVGRASWFGIQEDSLIAWKEGL